MKIKIEVTIKSDISSVWNARTNPKHITKWTFASSEWHCQKAIIDLKPGGKFSYQMSAKDNSMTFDFEGGFHTVNKHELITFSLGDGRFVDVHFISDGSTTTISETFEAEDEYAAEQQRAGWQAILNNFKNYVESL